MAGYVGVAPGTTTIMIRSDGSLGNHLGTPCGTENPWPYVWAPTFLSPIPAPGGGASSPAGYYNPYGSEAALKGASFTNLHWILTLGLGAVVAKATYSYLLSRRTRK